MYNAYNIVGSKDVPGQRNYFLNGADLDGIDKGISKKWKIVDFSEHNAGLLTHFSATTFANGDNIVIAYRGSDGEIGEWIQNIFTLTPFKYHSEEKWAQIYAAGVAEKYPDKKIYITGHSLGGYLAQVGASYILEHYPSANLKGVEYFNGVGSGLKFSKSHSITAVKDSLETSFKYLASYNGTLVSHQIKGDIVSQVGQHATKPKEYEPFTLVELIYLSESKATNCHRLSHFYYYLEQGKRKITLEEAINTYK